MKQTPKLRLIDYFTHEEMMLMRVIKRAMENAKTFEELEEAKQSMGILMKKGLKRAKEDRNKSIK